MNHNEHPIERTNPSGKTVWVARYTAADGAKRSAGTFALKRDAQQAINDAYKTEARSLVHTTLGDYAATWTDRHPRSQRTNDTNDHRVFRVLDVLVEGRLLRDWTYDDLRRRHVRSLADHLLRKQGRSALGATNILRTLSAMTEDAIEDEATELNPFRGVGIRANDPRVTKAKRPVRVWTFAEMHRFAAAAGDYEPLVRVYSDLGLRLGEGLPLMRGDLENGQFRILRTAHEGTILDGTKTDHGEENAGRVVPVPPGLAEMLAGRPTRIDTALLFPTPTGRLWRERNFYRDVWQPAREATGMDIRPHEMRHSWVSHLTAAGIDEADLAAVAGHTVETMTRVYRHALDKSADAIRQVIG